MGGGIFNKALEFFGFADEDFEEEELEQETRQDESYPVVKKKQQRSVLEKGGFERSNTVLSIHTQKHTKIVVVEPRSFDDVQPIADHLKNHRPVIVDLEESERELAKRIVDFLSGTCYALNGNIQKIGPCIFLFTPSNIDVMSEQKTESVDKQLFSWLK